MLDCYLPARSYNTGKGSNSMGEMGVRPHVDRFDLLPPKAARSSIVARG